MRDNHRSAFRLLHGVAGVAASSLMHRRQVALRAVALALALPSAQAFDLDSNHDLDANRDSANGESYLDIPSPTAYYGDYNDDPDEYGGREHHGRALCNIPCYSWYNGNCPCPAHSHNPHTHNPHT